MPLFAWNLTKMKDVIGRALDRVKRTNCWINVGPASMTLGIDPTQWALIQQ